MEPITLPGILESLDAVAEYVMAAAAEAGLDTSASYRLRLAIDEIATNIITHGYNEAGHEGFLELRADISDETLTVSLEDTSAAYDPREAPPPDVNLPPEQREIGGLGALIAMRSVDKFVYERIGDRNRSTFTINLPLTPSEE